MQVGGQSSRLEKKGIGVTWIRIRVGNANMQAAFAYTPALQSLEVWPYDVGARRRRIAAARFASARRAEGSS